MTIETININQYEVPYEGKLTVCYASSLSMVLKMQGIEVPLSQLEVLTTQPFGYFYLKSKDHPFAGNGMALSPNDGLVRAVETLGFQATQKGFENFEQAYTNLSKQLQSNPVILGPLDMGYLPQHGKGSEGADHYVIGIKPTEQGGLIIHDPEGYILFDLDHKYLKKAWEASRIVYEHRKYVFTTISSHNWKMRSEQDQLLSILKGAINNTAQSIIGTQLYFGPRAIEELISDINDGLNIALALPEFSLEMTNQRCWVSGWFLKSMSKYSKLLREAAKIRFTQSEIYGKARLYSKINEYSRIFDILNDDLSLESRFENLIQEAYLELVKAKN